MFDAPKIFEETKIAELDQLATKLTFGCLSNVMPK